MTTVMAMMMMMMMIRELSDEIPKEARTYLGIPRNDEILHFDRQTNLVCTHLQAYQYRVVYVIVII